jgi:hypothetical protein
MFDPSLDTCLQHFWQRQMQHAPASSSEQYHRDRLLTFAFGVGIEQMMRFLATPCTLAELKSWILELNGGALDGMPIRRLGAALAGAPYPDDIQQWLAAVEAMPPVLDADALQHWDALGYVIVPQAISPQACAAAAELVFASVAAAPDDPASWYARRNTQGIMVQHFQDARLQPARQSLRIHKAMAQLWGTADLFTSIDRCGFNPPERPGYAFPGPHLHWDADLTQPMPFATQAILYLTDTSADQGAFTCIPGFHRDIGDWLAGLPHDATPQDCIPEQRAVPIPGKAGDLIIWHHALPHGSSPNRSQPPRVVQYVNMLRAPDLTT